MRALYLVYINVKTPQVTWILLGNVRKSWTKQKTHALSSLFRGHTENADVVDTMACKILKRETHTHRVCLGFFEASTVISYRVLGESF